MPYIALFYFASYMKAAFSGDTIVAEARTSHLGKRLAFLTVDIKNKETGALLAQGKHTKFIGQQRSKTESEKSSS